MNKSRDTIKTSKITLALAGSLVMLVISYLYFLNMSVVHVVTRTEAIQQQNYLNAEIAELEAGYIESQNVIASRIAGMNGYNTDIPKVFVSREQASLVLGSN